MQLMDKLQRLSRNKAPVVVQKGILEGGVGVFCFQQKSQFSLSKDGKIDLPFLLVTNVMQGRFLSLRIFKIVEPFSQAYGNGIFKTCTRLIFHLSRVIKINFWL